MRYPIVWYTNAIYIESIKYSYILCFWLDPTLFTSNTCSRTTKKRYLLIYKYIELISQLSNIPNNHLFASLYLWLGFVSLAIYVLWLGFVSLAMCMWLLLVPICVLFAGLCVVMSSIGLCIVVSSAGLCVVVSSILHAFVLPEMYLWLCVDGLAQKTMHSSVIMCLFVYLPLGYMLLYLQLGYILSYLPSCVHLHYLRWVFGCVCVAEPWENNMPPKKQQRSSIPLTLSSISATTPKEITLIKRL